MTDSYAVIGNPIEHSKSPLIHHAFAEQTHQDIDYTRILAPLDGFAKTIDGLQKAGFKGANVTVPFKFEAFQLAGQLTERATAAGAVNTLIFNKDRILGDNTDGAGLVKDIQQNLGCALYQKRILLLGAGGAAQGVLLPLLAERPSQLIIANRSMDKAEKMQTKISEHGNWSQTLIEASSFENLNGKTFDIVINATSTGLSDLSLPLPRGIFAKDALAYEMMYGRETPLCAQMQKAPLAWPMDWACWLSRLPNHFISGAKSTRTQSVISRFRT